MRPRDGDAVQVIAELQKIAAGQPRLAVAGGNNKVELLSDRILFFQNMFAVIMKGNDLQPVLRKSVADLVPQIKKHPRRIQHG